jgi:hypothetical protein
MPLLISLIKETRRGGREGKEDLGREEAETGLSEIPLLTSLIRETRRGGGVGKSDLLGEEGERETGLSEIPLLTSLIRETRRGGRVGNPVVWGEEGEDRGSPREGTRGVKGGTRGTVALISAIRARWRWGRRERGSRDLLWILVSYTRAWKASTSLKDSKAGSASNSSDFRIPEFRMAFSKNWRASEKFSWTECRRAMERRQEAREEPKSEL